MAHIEKYQSSALGNMLGHYERRAELEHGYERENIDPERTHLNYNLCERESPLGFVDERIGGLEPAPQTVSESLRALWTARSDGAREGSLQERLRALEAESASLRGKISERESEWRSLTEGCLDYETAASELERDLSELKRELPSW